MSDEATSEFDEGLVLDLSEIADAPEREALRAGTYDVEVVDVEYKPSKKGDPMLVWIFQTTDPELENRRFWNYTVLNNETGQRIARDSILRINPEVDLANFTPGEVASDLVGRPCRVTIKVDTYEGRKTNQVKSVLAPSGDSGDFLS